MNEDLHGHHMVGLEGRRVVLVGGAGFIGHHLALALSARGARVSLIDGLAVNHLLTFTASDAPAANRDLYLLMLRQRLDVLRANGVDLFTQDARDLPGLRSRIEELDPHVVVHLAGVSHADRSNRDPHAAFEHTLLTLEHTLTAATSVEHLVFFSSSMVYGDFEGAEVTEETPCQPVGVYGALKLAGEKMVMAHEQVFGVPYTIIRPSALYGERCVSRRVGQIFIEAALDGEPLVVIGDGSDRLDFTYIDDLAQGMLRVVAEPAARNQVFNLTFGSSRSINDLVGILRESFPGLEVTRRPRPRLLPQRGTLNVDKARSVLDYAPDYPIEIGIPRYIDWYRSIRPHVVTRPRRGATAIGV